MLAWSCDASSKRRRAPVTRSPDGLREHVVRRLVNEGQQLLRVVVASLAEPIELSDSTGEVLAAFEVPSSGMVDWALRLALPVFSQLEVGALRQRIEKLQRRGDRLDGVPLEFAVQLFAHRLRRPVGGIARKATNGWAAEVMSVPGDRCEICDVSHDG